MLLGRRTRNAIAIAHPTTEIDQSAPLRAKRPRGIRVPHDGLVADGTPRRERHPKSIGQPRRASQRLPILRQLLVISRLGTESSCERDEAREARSAGVAEL